MGLVLSVHAGKHICPDGEVKVWQKVCRTKPGGFGYQQLDFMGFQQIVRDSSRRTVLKVVKNRQRIVSKMLITGAQTFLKRILGAFCIRTQRVIKCIISVLTVSILFM